MSDLITRLEEAAKGSSADADTHRAANAPYRVTEGVKP